MWARIPRNPRPLRRRSPERPARSCRTRRASAMTSTWPSTRSWPGPGHANRWAGAPRRPSPGRMSPLASRPMAARIIDGKAIAAKVREEVARDVEAFRSAPGGARGWRRCSSATTRRRRDLRRRQAEGLRRGRHRAASTTGCAPDAPSERGRALLRRAQRRRRGAAASCCQLPVPDAPRRRGTDGADRRRQGRRRAHAARAPGCSRWAVTALRPCTPSGVMVLLDEAGVDAARAPGGGRRALEPRRQADGAAAAGRQRDGDRSCHSRTRDLPGVCRERRRADRRRRPRRVVTADWVKPGAVVIDVGMNRSDGRAASATSRSTRWPKCAGAITPVPGGVGPMTIAMLLRNTLEAAEMAAAGERRSRREPVAGWGSGSPRSARSCLLATLFAAGTASTPRRGCTSRHAAPTGWASLGWLLVALLVIVALGGLGITCMTLARPSPAWPRGHVGPDDRRGRPDVPDPARARARRAGPRHAAQPPGRRRGPRPTSACSSRR